MDLKPRQRQSQWPGSFVLDEAWLRTRRVLVHRLECSGNWPETAVHNAFMQDQREQGERLKSRLLGPALGKDDYANVGGEAIFGASNYRFRRKLPYVLSFGYELGAGFGRLLDISPEHCEQVAEICALFNLGISVFDLLIDNFPELYGEFDRYFDEECLSSLLAPHDVAAELRGRSRKLVSTEARVVMKIIAEFSSRLRVVGGAANQRNQLSMLLLDAYQAEQQSADAAASRTGHASMLSTCRAKSTLPFAIMYEIARFLGEPVHAETKREAEELAHDIGKSFWLTDDLVDVVRDSQSGSPNSLLCLAGSDLCQAWEPSAIYDVLTRLLDGDYIDKTACEVCSLMSGVVERLEAADSTNQAIVRFVSSIRSYTRNWIE